MENETPDFSDSVDVSNDSIQTVTPDFSDSEDLTPPTNKISPLSKVANDVLKNVPLFKYIDAYKTLEFLNNGNWPEHQIDDTPDTYAQKVRNVLSQREQQKLEGGIGQVLETPMQVAVGAGLVVSPIGTIVGVAGFTALGELPPEIAPVVNLKKFSDKYFPETSPLNKDLIELLDFGIKGGIIGKGIGEGKKLFKSNMEAAGVPKNVNIDAKQLENIKNSPNLLPEEKIDLKATLGVKDAQVEASVNSGLPVNVLTEKLVDVAEKPYWERTRNELLMGGETVEKIKGQEGRQEVLNNQGPEAVKPTAPDIKDLQGLLAQKDISQVTMGKLRNFLSVENIKKATPEQINKLTSFVAELKPEDKFLSEKQTKALEDILKPLTVPEVTPKRIIVEKFGEKEAILPKGVLSKVSPELIPTVNIKQGHPLITKIVNNARDLLHTAEREVSRRNQNFDKMITAAEKSREKLLSSEEKVARKITPQNPEIFKALGGEKVELTKEEAAVVAYLRNFFEMARKDMGLEKYRKNYVTHMEKSLTEKILTKGLVQAVRETVKERKPNDLPVDIMLELDNIIGSEKFFKFAQERKGGIDPSTNLRQILNSYSNLYETKMALDKILPEGQAVTQELLKGKSAVWMKRFLQNLKGRGLDNQFKTGPMSWLAKVADGIVDIGYIKMLGLNWMSAIKNVVAGEANAWIYQDFPKYLEGKQRLISNPKKVYNMASEYGLLDGTYADFAQKGIGGLKKLQDYTMLGQRAGEIEVRGSIFAGSLTKAEWESGKVSNDKINEIRDIVALTQGMFSKVDSPLLLQTWYGRMFFQMNRWRITNSLLMGKIVSEASVDIKAGNYKTQNVARLGKMVVAYGTGMYIANQFYNAGYKEAGDVARNIANTIDGVATLFTDGDLVKMFTDNPTLSSLKEIAYTIQELADYLNIPGAEGPQKIDINKGIEDTYIAPVKATEDLIDSLN